MKKLEKIVLGSGFGSQSLLFLGIHGFDGLDGFSRIFFIFFLFLINI